MLSSSLTDDPPAILCLLVLSDCPLNTLLESSSGLIKLPLGLAGFNFLDKALDGGVEGDWWLCLSGEGGLSELS